MVGSLTCPVESVSAGRLPRWAGNGRNRRAPERVLPTEPNDSDGAVYFEHECREAVRTTPHGSGLWRAVRRVRRVPDRRGGVAIQPAARTVPGPGGGRPAD